MFKNIEAFEENAENSLWISLWITLPFLWITRPNLWITFLARKSYPQENRLIHILSTDLSTGKTLLKF